MSTSCTLESRTIKQQLLMNPNPEVGRRPAISMEERREGVSDRFSDLPDDVVHRILCLLDTKDVIRTGTLSKTFLSFWKSFPVLDFSWYDVRSSEDEFYNYVHRICTSRQDGSRSNTVLQKFGLAVRGPLPDDRFDRALTFAVRNRVQHLSLSVQQGCGSRNPLPAIISFAGSVTELTLEGFLLDENFSIQSFPSLEKLKLHSCRLGGDFGVESPNLKVLWFYDCEFLTNRFFEEFLPQLVLLETLTLRFCYNISRLEVRNDNLKRIELRCCNGLDTIEVLAENLHSFNYYGSYITRIRQLDISACKHLKSLELEGYGIPGTNIQEQVSTLLELDHLTLQLDTFPERIEINHRHLRSLHIDNTKCPHIKINTPRLVSFTYNGKLIPFESDYHETTLNTTLWIYPAKFLDTDYCLKWLEFVNLLRPRKLLTLSTRCDGDLVFPRELRKTHFGPLINLKHLKVEKRERRISTELMDSLLWLSPNLETLLFVSVSILLWLSPNLETLLFVSVPPCHKLLSIQFDYEMTINKEDGTQGCSNPLKECLSLKTVYIENFDPHCKKDRIMSYFREKAKSVYWK